MLAAMRLYHTPRTRSNRPLWMLEELGRPYELALLTRDERQAAEHRTRHPLGRVPVLETDDGCVFESAAICLQLADLHPDAGLIAAVGTQARALHYQWSVYAMTELESPIMDAARQLWASGEPNTAVVEAARARFATAADAYGAALAGAPFIVGGAFSVADIIAGGVLGFARRAEIFELSPAIAAYVDGLEARPAFARAYAISA